jgi:hypothetical protein
MEEYGAEITSLLRNNLEGRLTLLLLETSGESRTPCDHFADSFAIYPEIHLVHRRLAPDPGNAEIEFIFTQAINEDFDIVLVWAATVHDSDAAPVEDTAPYWRWPKQALAAAESVNLFDRCLVALVGDDIRQREARHLGYEDGFTASMPTDSLVVRLAREAIAHREARRRGSSPPCFL